MKYRMTYAGQRCRGCGTPVVKRQPKKHKKNSSYSYAWYLKCPNPMCRKLFLVEDAKRMNALEPDSIVFGIDLPVEIQPETPETVPDGLDDGLPPWD